HLLVEQLFGAGHHLVEHSAPFQFFNKIHGTICISLADGSGVAPGGATAPYGPHGNVCFLRGQNYAFLSILPAGPHTYLVWRAD
ncbi:MAG: hypothetical protein PUB53_06500, partial [Bacteroidales bacterium]|nr:hypothetical protein [Bacteroidales bacterium]